MPWWPVSSPKGTAPAARMAFGCEARILRAWATNSRATVAVRWLCGSRAAGSSGARPVPASSERPAPEPRLATAGTADAQRPSSKRIRLALLVSGRSGPAADVVFAAWPDNRSDDLADNLAPVVGRFFR